MEYIFTYKLNISVSNYRLTADDIRKQHPRVLANELETLKAQNQRLETQVHSLEEKTKQVVSQEVCDILY